ILASAFCGCHAGMGGGAATPPIATGDFTVVERSESGPIVAVASRGSYLWAAGHPGLRRWNVGDGEYEEVAAADEIGGMGLRALAVDDEGTAWVAGATEVGRWSARPSGRYKYEGAGSPGTVTVLAPRRPVATQGAWAGGPGGLYRFDGHHWAVVDGLLGVSVTSLTLDADGRGAWVGTRGKGLYQAQADARQVVPAAGGAAVTADEIVGTATDVAGTRLVAGNVGGEARLYALTLAGAFEFRAAAGIHAVALIGRGAEALLVAGPVGHEQAYTLRAFEPGEAVPTGGLRFSSVAEDKGGRWAGVPTNQALPPGVTSVAVDGKDLFCGSAARGVARAEAGRPQYFDGAELVGDANRFSVACETPAHCLIVTEGPRAWQTDGDHYASTGLGSAADATVLGFASDSQGGLYAMFFDPRADPRFKGVVINRRAPGPGDWQPWKRIALELPAHGTPELSFAEVSPTGELWLGLRVADESGDDVGYGAAEIDLQTGVAVQHRPRRPGEAAAPEALPLPADLTGILFVGSATWYASLAGVYRFADGQLDNWGESDGLPSDLVWSVGRGGDGTIWAATSEGLARWDGKSWHPAPGPVGATRGLATDDRGRLWVATAKGLRILPPGASDLSSATVLVEGDMRDLTRDRFGRTWALSSDGITFVTPRISAAAIP
ncbi:MAG TPA: hypothetical protein VFG23_24400, partial [Polyangia bacterium]|nr:hypothetical protein [Polyangia bacterium]